MSSHAQVSARRSGPSPVGGSVARMAPTSSWSHGCRIAFGVRTTGRACTSPVVGQNSVSNLAVPPRTSSCGRWAGWATGCQDAPGWGMAWYGPASFWHQTGMPSASAVVYARLITPVGQKIYEVPHGCREINLRRRLPWGAGLVRGIL